MLLTSVNNFYNMSMSRGAKEKSKMEKIRITEKDLEKYWEKAFKWIMSHGGFKDSNDLDAKIVGVIWAMKREESK